MLFRSRIVATTLDAADGVSRKSVDLSSAVFKFNEGRLGVAVGSLIGWWVEGIVGGVYEGVGEGMMELGLLKPQDPPQPPSGQRCNDAI